MSELNEFETAEQLSDLEFLKSLRPEWQNDRLEPLTPTPDDIIPPAWTDILTPDGQQSTRRSGDTDLELIQVIAGKEDGGTFVPGLVNAIGPFTEL